MNIWEKIADQSSCLWGKIILFLLIVKHNLFKEQENKKVAEKSIS